MLQRIQSIYLLLVILISGILPFILNNEYLKFSEEFGKDNLLVTILFIFSALLSLVTIFMFKNRKLQFVLGRLNIILNFILLGVFVYWSLTISGETSVSEKGIEKLIPVISIVLLVLANRAIKKDEELVKSVDRLR